MDFIQQLQNWSKGDIVQGWIMVCAAVLGIALLIVIIKSDNPLLKGMLVPVVLLLLMNLGYGSYLVGTKSKNADIVELQYKKSPDQSIKDQVAKLQREEKSYTITKRIWAALMAVSVLLYFVFTKDYYKGMVLGSTIMFLCMLLIDAFLHHRLRKYVSTLN